jgi:hypothetical protein
MSSDTDTDTTGGIDADDIVTNPDNVETTVAMKDSDFEPEKAQGPLNNNIVWVNHEDDPPHTATSGARSDDPDSGKIFNKGIINGGDQSAPLQLAIVSVGDRYRVIVGSIHL